MSLKNPKPEKSKKTKLATGTENLSVEYQIKDIISRIESEKKVRRSLYHDGEARGKIHIDRKLPFLCLYRKDGDDADEKLVMGEASYIIAPGGKKYHAWLSKIVYEIASHLSAQFGAFLIIEVWTRHVTTTADMAASPPHFKIHRPPIKYPQFESDVLITALENIRVQKQRTVVEYSHKNRHYPDEFKELISPRQAEENNIHFVGLEVGDIYRDSNTQVDFPKLKHKIWRGLSRSIKRMVFDFVQKKSSYRPAHYHALGKNSLVKSVWDIDKQLADISKQLDLVLSVTPTNTMEAYKEFKAKNFERAPKFLYRPLTIHPGELKRELYSINIDRIEDPAMSQLFLLQQRGLDNKISLMADRGSSRFIYGSLQLYGKVDEYHVDLARYILNNVKRLPGKPDKNEILTIPEFRAEAEKELSYYNSLNPVFDGKIEIRDDIPGVMVSGDTLLISEQVKIHRKRFGAVLQHEVGTHLLTYFNGQSQPFRQLQTGLIGYDELQEGLAVLAEYLDNGLTSTRMRTLAARTLVCRMMIDGASFIDAFRELTGRYRFPPQTAFKIVTRVFRGGGLTKDSVYLKGLVWLLEYFRRGGEADILFVGKYPIQFMPFIKELLWREVIKPPLVLPRYISSDQSENHLDKLRTGITVEDLCARTRA